MKKRTYISIEEIPSWRANHTSSSQEIPQILWTAEVHYHVRSTLLLFRFLSQSKTVHTSAWSIFIAFSHLCLDLPGGLSFPTKKTAARVSPLRCTCCKPCLYYHPWLNCQYYLRSCDSWSSSLYTFCLFHVASCSISALKPVQATHVP